TAQADTAASADADMAIRSPLAARVEYRLVEPGTVIGAGSRVISLLDPADVSMNVFLPNATVGGLRVGDEARLVLDGIDAVFPAQVSFIASEAQFTPKAVETADEREKLVFRVKLKVPADVAQRYDRLLKGGMTGDGYVRRDSSQAWPLALEVRLP
ncbi:HlyD family efflux transporter periplasmic adaptor subunit, partial [Cardiobacterium hominis]